MDLKKGWLSAARHVSCNFFNQRPANCEISVLVIHNISLPPGKFGGSFIEDLFTGKLDPKADPFFESIHKLEVSAHLLIRRDGEIVQFVSFDDRAWHAGLSSFQGRSNCNDFSIGIELEGTDEVAYTDAQYAALVNTAKLLMKQYPQITLGRIIGHNDIAPKRKTDPGVSFDWPHFRRKLCNSILNEDDE